MCGRFILIDNAEHIAQLLGIPPPHAMVPRYNIAPSQSILSLRLTDAHQPELIDLSWGLIPSWIKDIKKAPKPINAKSETVWEQPYFRSAIKKRRCLIPANGFYEWQAVEKIKQPYLMQKHDHGLFCFAGLWERWVANDGEVIESATILTTNANQRVAFLHNRMPVILPKDCYEAWLDPDIGDREFLSSMLRPASEDFFEVAKVSTVVNSPKNNVPACIEPLAE